MSANLEGFLRQWKAAAEAEDRKEIQQDWSEGLKQLHQIGSLHAHVEILLGLNRQQLDMLVHAGSPLREVVSKERPRKPLSSTSTGSDWVEIAASEFQMGSEQNEDERPVHKVSLSAIRIAKYPVTNAQYVEYVKATDAQPPKHWQDGKIPEGKENHPKVYVSWWDAVAYCRWQTQKIRENGQQGQMQLPSEAEWEYAARGNTGREYPWGNEAPDKERCNFNNNVDGTSPVGSYPKGATPEGVHYLAGNVWEWTRSKWEQYPYPTDENRCNEREALSGNARRVLRGFLPRTGARPLRLSRPRRSRLP